MVVTGAAATLDVGPQLLGTPGLHAMAPGASEQGLAAPPTGINSL